MTARISGVGELRSAFGEVSEDMKLRTSRVMVAAAGGVLRKESRRLAQQQGLVKTGALVKNIVIKREKTPEGTTQYNLGVRHGRALGKNAKTKLVVNARGRVATKYEDDPWYWYILEFGRKVYTGDGKRKRSNTVRSKVEATPFIAPALINKQAEAIEAMATRLAKALQKANSP